MYGHPSAVKPSPRHLSTGRVPFWLRQKSLISVSAHTLRPGGLTLTRRAVEVCDFKPGDRILDVGCGYGMTLTYLLEHHGIRGTGIDPDPGIIPGMGQAPAPRHPGPAPAVLRGALPSLPFLPETWTGIFCECVLSLSPDPAAWLSECHRLLAPNGKLVLTDLYIRKWSPQRCKAPGPDDGEGACAAGARTLMEMMTDIEKTGFKIDILEDHTGLLSQLGTPSVNNKTGYCMILAGKYH
ncbi:MAG: methyltransferase domain-containing protein [Desulfobacter sp.]|nr:MAG: methyltransferase domain-containing protein [Desulfobacter sp.]